ncbi:PREDICTED: hemicentin-1-like isoform X1 [Branchiostoma belcheri]|uniref:Hemicentin-1-like isoform X1 n=1 Tax=Branchiostoma belcheri TaxID=7741 RepID=A0A6P4YPD3_BRABE|nr:PREDICTED: hemicentin-1-like isoform X1 [Branchiostoma belcheri]
MKEAGGREEGLAVGLLLLHLVPAVFSNKFMSVTVHGMVGDTVTFPASYDSDKDIIVLTWNKLDQDIEGRRVPVYIYTPVSRTSLALGPLKGRAELHQNGSLTIRKINEADEGHYVMTVLIDTIGQEEQYVFLDIVVPPKVDIGLVGPELVPTNSSLTLNCSVDKTNSKVKAVFWMKDNELLSRDTTRVDYEGPNSYKSSILLEKMTRKDSGNYSCVAEHIRSVVVDSVQVEVTYPPVVLNITSPRFTTVGATVTLWCIVDGNPTPKVLWYKSGNSQPIGLSSTLDHIVSYLTLHDLQTSDSGEYLCRAFNGKYRNDSRAVELTVLGEGTASYSNDTTSRRRWLEFWSIMGGAVGGTALLLTSLLVVIVCSKSKGRRKPRTKHCGKSIKARSYRLNDGTLMLQGSCPGTLARKPERILAKTVSSYKPPGDGGLTLEVDDIVEVLHKGTDGWWYGFSRGTVGLFPASSVQVIGGMETVQVSGYHSLRRSHSHNDADCHRSKHGHFTIEDHIVETTSMAPEKNGCPDMRIMEY